jgi:hypothetical protein
MNETLAIGGVEARQDGHVRCASLPGLLICCVYVRQSSNILAAKFS